jgi:hypothetical protein
MKIVALFGSLGRKRSHATKLLPLSLASPSPWPHSAPSHFPHSCGCRLIAQATMARPAAILPGSHGLAPRTTCSRPYQPHNGVQIRAREKRSAPPAGRRRRRPQSLCPRSHQRLKIRSQLLLPLQLQVFMDPSPMYLILSSNLYCNYLTVFAP